MKENDWLLNNLTNPTFGIEDFKSVGLNTENTSFESEEVYKNSPVIQKMFLTPTGEFDENKFHNAYLAAAYQYNNFTNDEFVEDVNKEIKAHRNNIYFDLDQRESGPEIYMTREPNPLREISSVIKLGKVYDNKLSSREIAQREKVLLNPIEYERDGAEPIWGEAPNDSFFSDFFETRVLAQWDEDGEHKDLVTGQIVKHKKGDLKLNDKGTVFYENLQGRDIYDKQVLSKLDIITTDGSKWNKYDFFDSDDKDKSYIGSIFKLAATLAPLATPIAPYYVGVGIALLTAKLGATLGKLFLGNNNKTLSSIEGFVKSVEPTVSDESMEEMWTVENMLNLVGDVYLQLYQQRWLFQYGPALFKGGKPMATEAALLAKLKEYLDKYSKGSFDDLLTYIQKKGMSSSTGENLFKIQQEKAMEDMRKFMTEYNTIGKYLSRAYMTGITTADAYGDAIREGATDLEAAFLTLGYTAAQYALMSTALGERILPELRAEKLIWRDLQRKLVDTRKATIEAGSETATKLNKYNWLQKLYNIGYEAGSAAKTIGPKVFTTVGSNALGEGIEETTEELLYDFTKSIFNGVLYLRGKEGIIAWDNVLDRYSMSFIGGMLGGGLMELRPSIRNARNIPEITSESAMQELVKIVRNGLTGEFLRTLDKNTLGRKDVSFELVEDKGVKIFKPVDDSTMSQDEYNKLVIRNIVKNTESILNSQGAKAFDEKILDDLTRKDLKFNALRNSATASIYLLRYNTLATELTQLVNQYNSLTTTSGKMQAGVTDQLVKEDPEIEKRKKELMKEIDYKNSQLQEYHKDKLSSEFIYLGIFEMSEAVRNKYLKATNLRSYIEANSDKPIKDLDLNTIEKYTKEWNAYKSGLLKDDLDISFKTHKYITKIFSNYLTNHDIKYFQNVDQNQLDLINNLERSILSIYSGKLGLNNSLKDPTSFLNKASLLTSLEESVIVFKDLVLNYGSPEDKQIMLQFLTNPMSVGADVVSDAIIRTSEKILENIVLAYVNQGYINPEIKRGLLKVIGSISLEYHTSQQRDKLAKITKLRESIVSLDHSNMYELLDLFNLTLGSDINISNILKAVTDALNSTLDIELFTLPPNIQDGIDSALLVIDLLEAQILSARVDMADVDNILGLNKTANELNSELHLPEIASRLADAMLFDLNLIKLRISFARNLISVNTGQKLTELDMTAAKFQLVVFKRLKDFQLPDDWDTEDWNAAISSMSKSHGLLSKLENKLSQEEREDIRRENKILDQAIHNLFIKNKDKLTDLNAEIFMKNFNLLDNSSSVLNREITSINDRNLFWYMVTRFAVNPSDFYYSYKLILSDDLAPFYSLEIATYTVFAHIINNTVFQDFSKIYNEAVANQIKNIPTLEDAVKKYQVSKEYPYSSDYNASRSYISFIEGMPGTGKSAGVFNNVVSLLRLTNNDLLKKVWIVHATKESAEKLAKELGLENYVALDKESYMKAIAPKWSELFNQEGNLIINPEEISENDFVYSSSLDVNRAVDASLVLVDEFSKYSFVDIDLQNKFSKLTGVPIAAAGDLMQSRISGEIKTNKGDLKVTQELVIDNRSFVTSPKLGVLLRATSESMVKSIIKFTEAMPKLLTTSDTTKAPIDIISLNYQEILQGENKGLYGVKVAQEYDTDEIMKSIDLMISTQLDPKEKIGYVYNNEDSELYKTLSSNPKYSDKIKFLKGTSSLGLEAKYYIVEDFSVNYMEDGKQYTNWKKYYTDLYTSLTRSKQGCLWVLTLYLYPTEFVSMENTNDTPVVISLSKLAIKDYSLNRKQYLETEYPSGNFPKFVPREGAKTEPVKVQEQLPETEDGLTPSAEVFDITLKASEELSVKTPSEVIKTGPKGTEFNLLMSSTFSRETGFVTKDSKLVKPNNYDKRIDNLNGLTKLISKGARQSEQDYIDSNIELLESLRDISYRTEDVNDLAQKINNLLGLNASSPYVKFFVKSSAKNSHDTDNLYYKDPNELLYSIYSNGSKAKNHFGKTLSLIFGTENGDLLELTLLTFPNVKTLLKHDLFKDIQSIYEGIERINGKAAVYKNLVTLKDKLKDSDIVGAKLIINLIDFFTFTQNGAFYIDDPDWSIKKNATTYGIRVINLSKGLDYSSEGYESFKSEWYPLNDFKNDYVFNISDDIYISPSGTIETGSKTIKFAKPGMPFILVSETKNEFLKLNLFDTYIKELDEFGNSPTVSLIYLVPPKASLEKYAENIYNILKGTGTVKSIGNDFTAYRILNYVLDDPRIEWETGLKEVIKKYIDLINASENKIDILEQDVAPGDVVLRHKVTKVKKFLLAHLYNLLYDENQNARNNLDVVKLILESKRIDGIFYNTTYNKASDATTNGIISVSKDAGSYSIDGNPFYINGKLDKSGYYMDMGSILQSISDKIKENKTKHGNILISTDNKRYESRKSNIIEQNKSVKDSFLESLVVSSKEVNSELSAYNNEPITELIKVLNSNNRLVFEIDGKYLVTPKLNGEGLEINKYSNINVELILPDSSNIKTFKIYADNDVYMATIQMDNAIELTISKLLDSVELNVNDFSDIDELIMNEVDPEAIFIQISEDFEGMYDGALEYNINDSLDFWNSFIENYQIYIDINSLEEFDEKMNKYDKDSTIYKILERLKNSKPINEYNEGCNSIKIKF